MSSHSNAHTTADGPPGRGRASSSLLLLVVLVMAVASSCAGLSDKDASTGAGGGSAANRGRTATNAGPVRADAQQPGATPGRMQLPASVADAEIATPDGRSFRLSDYKGKVVVLNLWATWCGPCRLEIPHLVEMNREYKGRGVEIVGLTTEDPMAAGARVQEFAREHKIDYQLGYADASIALALMQNRTSIPQVFVIRDGTVYYRFIGFNPQSSPPRLRDAIETTLKAGA